jgi:hypothetical protein
MGAIASRTVNGRDTTGSNKTDAVARYVDKGKNGVKVGRVADTTNPKVEPVPMSADTSEVPSLSAFIYTPKVSFVRPQVLKSSDEGEVFATNSFYRNFAASYKKDDLATFFSDWSGRGGLAFNRVKKFYSSYGKYCGHQSWHDHQIGW